MSVWEREPDEDEQIYCQTLSAVRMSHLLFEDFMSCRSRSFWGVTGRRDRNDRGKCKRCEEIKREWVRVIRVKVKQKYEEMWECTRGEKNRMGKRGREMCCSPPGVFVGKLKKLLITCGP